MQQIYALHQCRAREESTMASKRIETQTEFHQLLRTHGRDAVRIQNFDLTSFERVAGQQDDTGRVRKEV